MQKNSKRLLLLFICVVCSFTYFIYKKQFIMRDIPTTKINKCIKKDIFKYIPEDTELERPSYPKKSKYIMYTDLCGDKEKEVIMTFKDKKDKNTGGVIVLKKDGEQWKEILKECEKNTTVYEVTFADLDGDNKDELLVGYSNGEPLKNILKVYKYDEEKNKLKVIGKYKYSKLDVKAMPTSNKEENKKKKIALWSNLNGDAYIINVLKYDKGKLIESKEDYPYYFSKVVDYYKSKIRKKDNKNSATMWYYLVDAQIKANKQKEALNSIYEVKKIKPNGYENMEEMFKNLEKYIVDNFK